MINFNKKIIFSILSLLVFSSEAADIENKLTPSSQHLLKSLEVDIKQTLIMLEESELSQGSDLEDFRYHAVLPQSIQRDLGLILENDRTQGLFKVLAVSPTGMAAELNIKPNDLIINVNNQRIEQSNNSMLFNQLQQNSLEPVSAITIIRNKKVIKLKIPSSDRVVPQIQLTIGEIEQTPDITSLPNQINTVQKELCGAVVASNATPTERDIYPATIVKVNSDVTVGNDEFISLPVGVNTIYFRETFNEIKEVNLYIAANTSYYFGVKNIKDKKQSTSPADYWLPIIWETRSQEVNCDE